MIVRIGLLSLVLTSAVAVQGCGAGHTEAPQTVPVRIAPVTSRAFASTLSLSGTLVSLRNVTLGATVGGRITEARVQVGDRVGAGQILATIDDAPYQAALAQANGAHTAAGAGTGVASAQLADAKARFSLAVVTERRISSLYAGGFVARQQLDQSKADLAVARAAVVQAQAALAQAQGNVAQSSGAVAVAAVPLSNVTVRAPFEGIIIAKAIDTGAVVSPGAAVYTLEDDRNLEVDLAVPEDTAATLTPGTAVRVRVDALGRDVPAHIRAIVPAGGADLHTATVKVALTSTPGTFSGMYARVMLSQQSPRKASAVPWNAVVTRAGQLGVFEISAGRATFVPVESGATQNGFIEVRGISDGHRVAVSGLERLSDGAAVTLQ